MQTLNSPEEEQARLLQAGNLVLNFATYGVTLNGVAIALTYQEFELLKLLVEQAGRIVSNELLTKAFWDESGRKEVRRLSVLVCRLRAKTAGSWPFRIETVRGRGYGLLARSN